MSTKKVELNPESWCIVYKRSDYTTPLIDGGYVSEAWAKGIAAGMKRGGADIIAIRRVDDLVARLGGGG